MIFFKKPKKEQAKTSSTCTERVTPKGTEYWEIYDTSLGVGKDFEEFLAGKLGQIGLMGAVFQYERFFSFGGGPTNNKRQLILEFFVNADTEQVKAEVNEIIMEGMGKISVKGDFSVAFTTNADRFKRLQKKCKSIIYSSFC